MSAEDGERIDTATLLLEVGTEELPSGAVASALEQLKTALLTRLTAERLPMPETSVTTYATPRRLTLLLDGLPTRQTDAPLEVRGPSAKVAFDAEGKPTKAAQGFAAKQGVPVESLTVEGEYVMARRIEEGKPSVEVLSAAMPGILRSLTFPKFMRWGAGNLRWGRPFRRFVAVLGSDVIPFEVEGVVSGRETVGHRFLAPETITFPTPDGYAEKLRAASVEPDPNVRRSEIIAQANALAETIGGKALLPEALVDENVYLTETVTAVLGSFDPTYLTLPRPVLETAMKKHQRFFPVEGADGNLLPNFIAIRSGNDQYLDTVRAGYEGVLSSRFNDARFFYEHDRQSTLSEKRFKIGRIVFQEKLGTLADKTARLLAILEGTHLLHWTHDSANAKRAAELSKVDLATEIVMELPALQGVMGREFATLEGEPEAVAHALWEQYLPRFAGDTLPKGRIGTALALADRTDTLVGYMLFVGAEPKGSSDPFGLKRAASAIIDLLARDRALPPLSLLLSVTEKAYLAQGLTPAEKPGDRSALLETRLRSLLEERGNRYDLVDALLAAPYDNIASVVKRSDVLSVLLNDADERPAVEAATRVRNILKSVKEPLPETPDRAHLTTPEERTLLAFIATVGPQVEKALQQGDYTDALDTLAALAEPIGRLFDRVLIMDENPDVRTARLSLLSQIDRLFLRLADFSKLLTE